MATQESKPRVPPRWFVVTAWHVHRGIYRVTRGRKGLWAPRPGKWGGLPAWWLNLQANPDAVVDLRDGRREVQGNAAVGSARERPVTA